MSLIISYDLFVYRSDVFSRLFFFFLLLNVLVGVVVLSIFQLIFFRKENYWQVLFFLVHWFSVTDRRSILSAFAPINLSYYFICQPVVDSRLMVFFFDVGNLLTKLTMNTTVNRSIPILNGIDWVNGCLVEHFNVDQRFLMISCIFLRFDAFSYSDSHSYSLRTSMSTDVKWWFQWVSMIFFGSTLFAQMR